MSFWGEETGRRGAVGICASVAVGLDSSAASLAHWEGIYLPVGVCKQTLLTYYPDRV